MQYKEIEFFDNSIFDKWDRIFVVRQLLEFLTRRDR